jgi:hypothetical protein
VALWGAIVLLLVAGVMRTRGSARRAKPAAEAPASTAGPTPEHPKAKPPPIPDLAAVTGSCLTEKHGGRTCTDYIATPEEIKSARAACAPGVYIQAVWSDAPCDHASSNGGCWSSTRTPTQIQWFYGEVHQGFRPGPDTYKVCGPRSLGFDTSGHPIDHDGVPLPAGAAGIPVPPADRDP